MRTSCRTSSLVTLARRLCLPRCSGALKPGVSVGTTKPWISPSSLAQTTATSAIVPFVIHILAPLRTKLSPSRTAFVSMLPGSLPWLGSVRPKQPIAEPSWRAGSQRALMSSLP